VLIPIGHDRGVWKRPYVTMAIIAACTLIQLYSTLAAPGIRDVLRNPELLDQMPILRWGYQTGSGLDPNLVFSLFVHDGWFHLIGNMIFLWLAGSAVEDRWGHVRFAIFYLVGGVVATYTFEAFHDGPGILVGASGAITATMGAFLVHFSNTEIRFWYFFMFRTGTFEMAAWFALPLWLLDQILWAYLTEAHGIASGVAYTAHIGGFVFGVAAALLMKRFLPPEEQEEERIYYQGAPQAAVQAAAPTDRYSQLVAAIESRDLGTVRMLASRTILDASREGDQQKVLDVAKAMLAKLDRLPLTDGAFVAAANAADELGDRPTFVRLAEAVIAEHPGSSQIPKTMWRLAELRRDGGDVDAAIELLRTLAVRFPRDAHGQRAQQALDSRGLS
jgi:membrane associated rhomboid family serine protease